MSTAARVALTPQFDSTSLDEKSVLAARRERSTVVSRPRVLLAGRQGAWSDMLLKSLQKFDSELSFVLPDSVTPDFVREGGEGGERGYIVLLLDSTVSAEQRRDLASALAGSNASVYYTFPVENGCWWLPALQNGKDCHGAPAFRRREFQAEIERILGDHSETHQ
jgi:hypothetical protein